jgi:hypothetical protein
MIEAVVCPEWQYRYYSFNAGWAPGEEMASMRNGMGWIDGRGIIVSGSRNTGCACGTPP